MPRKPEPKNKRLADAIKASGLLKRAIADRVGVSTATLGQWINHAVKPQKVYRHKLAEVLGVDVFAEDTPDE